MATSTAADTDAGGDGRANPRTFPPIWWSWFALGGFFVCVSVADAVLAVEDATMPEGAVLLLRFVSLFLTWQWLETECRPYRQTYPLDMGMFLYAAGLGLMPYYMWRNQRWRGLLKMVALLAIWAAAYAVELGGTLVLRTLLGE